jgi:hypothetical protein
VESVFRETDPVPPEQAGTWQNLQPDTVTGFLRRIPDIFRGIPTGNSAFSAGFSRKIHGILRQESSSWEELEGKSTTIDAISYVMFGKLTE